jgi:uroporphyrinogen III methyltransferase/synthase
MIQLPIHIIVTQSDAHLTPLSMALASRGVQLYGTPFIEVQPIAKPLPDLSDFNWIFFTSQMGVQSFFQQLKKQALATKQTLPTLPRIAVVGPQTEQSVLKHGGHVDFVSPVFNAKEAAEAFLTKHHPEPREGEARSRVIWPCSQSASPEMKTVFSHSTAFELIPYPIYQTQSKLYALADLERLETQFQKASAILFTSPSNVTGWASQMRPIPLANTTAILSIGPSTTQALLAHGIEPLLEASPHQVSSAIETYLFSQVEKEPKTP